MTTFSKKNIQEYIVNFGASIWIFWVAIGESKRYLAKTPIKNLLPFKTFSSLLNLIWYGHGRIIILAAITVSISVLTPKSSASKDFPNQDVL